MELMWIIYLIDTLTGRGVDAIGIVLPILGGCVYAFSFILESEQSIDKEQAQTARRVSVRVFVSVIFITLLLPNNSTAYKMLAAYGVTEVYQAASESERVQKLAGKSLQVLDKAMDSYLEDAPKSK